MSSSHASYFIFSPEDNDIELVLPQFVNALITENTAPEIINQAIYRFRTLAAKGHAAIALEHNTQEFLGIIFYEDHYNTAELSYPYSLADDTKINKALIEIAAGDCLKNGTVGMRIEKQIIPGREAVNAANEAGFLNHSRYRMSLDLTEKMPEKTIPPAAINFKTINIKYLPEIAKVIISANENTKDAEIFYPLLFDTKYCTKWLERVFSGYYGKLLSASRLAFRGNELVGVCLIVELADGIAGVMEISVLKNVSGRGIGTALTSASMAQLHDDGYDIVELAVTKGNTAAKKIYEKLGFVEVNEYTVCYKDRT